MLADLIIFAVVLVVLMALMNVGLFAVSMKLFMNKKFIKKYTKMMMQIAEEVTEEIMEEE